MLDLLRTAQITIAGVFLLSGLTIEAVESHSAHHPASESSTAFSMPHPMNDGAFPAAGFCSSFMRNMFGNMLREMHTGMMDIMHSGGSLPHAHGGAIKPSALLREPNSPGAKAFSNNCAQCHVLPSPTAHTAAQWPMVIDRMLGYVAAQNKTMPSQSEIEAITEYLSDEEPSTEVATIPDDTTPDAHTH